MKNLKKFNESNSDINPFEYIKMNKGGYNVKPSWMEKYGGEYYLFDEYYLYDGQIYDSHMMVDGSISIFKSRKTAYELSQKIGEMIDRLEIAEQKINSHL